MVDDLVKKMQKQCENMECGNCKTCLHRQAVEELSKRRWIPVTERFPEDGMTVLVTDGCSIDMAVYNQLGSDWAGGIFVDCGSVVPLINADYVTHWQPLPDLPKEGK